MKSKILVFIALTMILLTQTAYAAPSILGWWPEANPHNIFWDNYISSNSKYAWSAGATAWNDRTNDIDFVYTSNYESYLGAFYDENTTAIGTYVMYVSGTTIESCDAYLNEYYTNNDWYYNSDDENKFYFDSNLRQAAAAHELGHVLGLGEADSPYDQSIMIPASYAKTYGIYVPQPDDIYIINDLY